MTDNEIIKALECVQKNPVLGSLDDKVIIASLDLINRLQEQNAALISGQETLQRHIAEKDKEIERWRNLATFYQAEAERANNEADDIYIGFSEYRKAHADVKFKTISEFKKRIKMRLSPKQEYERLLNDVLMTFQIVVDNIADEMVGDDK